MIGVIGSWRARAAPLTAVLLAVSMWLTMAFAESRNGPTSDEYWHMMRGVAALRAPDTRLNRPHPPLAQALAMLPVSLTHDPKLDELPGYERAHMPRVASAYVSRDYPESRARLRVGRLTNAALASAFLLFVFTWLRRRHGEVTAIAGSLLYATCPIVLAHGALVSNDFALGAATVLSLAAIIAYLERGGWARLVLAGFAVSLLPAIKVSGLLVVALEMLLPFAWLLQRQGAYGGVPLRRAVPRLLRDYAVVAVVVLFTLNLVYRFQLTFLTPEQLEAVAFPPGGNNSIKLEGALSLWPRSWPLPVPFTYLKSLMFIENKNATGHSTMWFGAATRAGSSLYFPFMLLGKTQALLLPLIVAGFVLDARKMLAGAGKWLLFIGLGFLGFAMTSKINIGVRHVFPTVVCLLMLGALAAGVVLARLQRVPRRALAVAVAAAVSLASGVAVAFPAFIGDFNVLVGNELGRRANVVAEDWGQDSADLARELRDRGIRAVALVGRHNFSERDVENEGVRVKSLACSGKAPRGVGAIAIHRTIWERKKRCYKALRRRTPDFIVHHNVLVFLTSPRR